jgi:hypothetical protein
MASPASMADRDDELRRLVGELDQLDLRRAAVQRRIKQLLGLAGPRKARSRFSQQDLDAWARGTR